MAGFSYLASQSKPKLRPGLASALGYIGGVLLMSGGMAQVALGRGSDFQILGVSGPPLVALGIVGILAGPVNICLAAYVGYGRDAATRVIAGYATIAIALGGLFTSFLGFFLCGTTLGVVGGVLAVRGWQKAGEPLIEPSQTLLEGLQEDHPK